MSIPRSKSKSLSAKIFTYYRYKIFPKVNHIRGSTRLNRFLRYLALRKVEKIEKEPEPISQKKWDNLIILDAARYDLYTEEVNPEADHRISMESHSMGFIKENFSEGDWSDTVVITANPFYHESKFNELTGRTMENVFHTVFHVYETDWSDEEGTVMPGDVVEKAKTAEKLFPEKRKIIHFMQPHHPFIDSSIDDPGYGDALEGDYYEKVWERAEKGNIDHKKVVEGFRNNYNIVMPHIEDLSDFLKGKTAITADHGNLVGENGIYGHPGDSKLEPLRKVPWDVENSV